MSEFAREWRRRHLYGRPHRILADVEVRAFVDKHIDLMTFDGLSKALRERFGPERGVEPVAIGRYLRMARAAEACGMTVEEYALDRSMRQQRARSLPRRKPRPRRQ